ncbi:hypothetical protein BKA66DRAFT_576690 [Pyrenochaeta sp. MPI-SDFR-AT-0127]|nr:hypothetical protein BKA66DRAFT_576690 [Pyrenochaeta sp. MPI-SDFR-AT-0127]
MTGPQVVVADVPTPMPKANQVLIRVVVCGFNRKDVTSAFYLPPSNFGIDIAGAEASGSEVIEFRKANRVAAFHEILTPDRAMEPLLSMQLIGTIDIAHS